MHSGADDGRDAVVAETDSVEALREGMVIVETCDVTRRRTLTPAERMPLPVGAAHRASGAGGAGGAACRFMNIRAGGAYDFQALDHAVDEGGVR